MNNQSNMQIISIKLFSVISMFLILATNIRPVSLVGSSPPLMETSVGVAYVADETNPEIGVGSEGTRRNTVPRPAVSKHCITKSINKPQIKVNTSRDIARKRRPVNNNIFTRDIRK